MRSGLILAGGLSSRFGAPKAFAPFRGRPMIRWVADALASRCDEILVSVRYREEAERFRTVLPEARVAVDVHHDRGPIEGMARGLDAARGDLVLVAPCDAPLLRPALYDLLLESLAYREAAVPRPRVLDPVRAVYRRDAALRTLAERAPDSPASLAAALWPVILDEEALRVADPELVSFVDVNRREDLREAARRAPVGMRTPPQGICTPSPGSREPLLPS